MTDTMEFNECLGSNREGEGMLVFRRHVVFFLNDSLSFFFLSKIK